MDRKAVSGIMLTLLLSSMFTLAFNIQPVKSDWTWTETIYIRADGSVDPDTAPISTVDNITYTLTDNIVGDVPMWESAIVVEKDNVVVNGAGLTLQGTGASWTKGISLSGRRNVTIRNIKIKKFEAGITLSYSSNNNIYGNNITANTDGIRLFESLNNTISGNNVTNNGVVGILGVGIYVFSDSHHNNIHGNRIRKNYDGIWLYLSDNNNVSGNTIADNNRGIALNWALNNTLSDNVIEDNSDGIWCMGSMNNKLSGNRITNNNCGVYLYEDSNCNSIFGNNITNSDQGIWLRYSSNNSVSGNYIMDNQKCGIWVYKDSNYNNISENNIINNFLAIWFCTFSRNKFYHNNFINNRNQVFAEPYNVNIWDDGYPSGGNYWSDHVTVDDYSGINQDEPGSDGIVDEPYIIDDYNRDNYPLVEPWSPKPLSPMEVTQELIETTESWNLPKGIENSLTSKLDNAIHLLDKGNEKGATHKLMAFINQVEALQGKKLANEQVSYLISEAQRIICLMEK